MKKFRRFLKAAWLVVSLVASWTGGAAYGESEALRPEVEAFVAQMAQQHGFAADELRNLFVRARFQPGIIKAMTTATTPPPWNEYRAQFVNPERIAGGVKFWDGNATALARARAAYGVPEEIVVATIGVETFYGRRSGSHYVLEALATLAFDYPPRADFFRGELEQYLLLARELGVDPLSLKGSYAGAMGMAQFMPSSYRQYAVDGDGDGRADLWNSAADAIASVANYYRIFGWEAGQAVVVPAAPDGTANASSAETACCSKPQHSVAELKQGGIVPLGDVAENLPAALYALETPDGVQHWLGLNNFYVITRYNRSVMYALAVHQLGQEIAAARQATLPTGALQ